MPSFQRHIVSQLVTLVCIWRTRKCVSSGLLDGPLADPVVVPKLKDTLFSVTVPARKHRSNRDELFAAAELTTARSQRCACTGN